MPRSPIPSAADLLFITVAPSVAIISAVRLTQSDGDLAGHIRMGDTILASGHLPAHSLASYTAATKFILGIMPTHKGLKVSPCIPKRWQGFGVVRQFRGGEMAEILGVSQRTVEFHRASIRKSLGITTAYGLMRFAIMLRVSESGEALPDDLVAEEGAAADALPPLPLSQPGGQGEVRP